MYPTEQQTQILKLIERSCISEVELRQLLKDYKFGDYIKVKSQSSRIEDHRLLCMITEWQNNMGKYKLSTYHSLIVKDVEVNDVNSNKIIKNRCFFVDGVNTRKEACGESGEPSLVYWFQLSLNEETLNYDTENSKWGIYETVETDETSMIEHHIVRVKEEKKSHANYVHRKYDPTEQLIWEVNFHAKKKGNVTSHQEEKEKRIFAKNDQTLETLSRNLAQKLGALDSATIPEFVKKYKEILISHSINEPFINYFAS